MSVAMYVLFILIIVGLLLIWYANTYNKFQSFMIRINEAEASIDTALRKRFDLLNKSIHIIQNTIKPEKEVLEIIIKLRSRKLSNFELDRQLYEAINEFHEYKENYKELLKSESFVKIDIALNESEAEIIALRKYYNDIITDYNKLVKNCPSNLVALIKSYKSKDYFDGNNIDKIKGTVKL